MTTVSVASPSATANTTSGTRTALTAAGLVGALGSAGYIAGQDGWLLRTQPWPEDVMQLVTVQVTFAVQGQEYAVRLSSLVNNLSQ